LEVVAALEVEHDAALASVVERVGWRVPQRPARRVDANYVRALVSKHERGQRPGDVLPEVDDAEPIERAWHTGAPTSRGRPPRRCVATRPQRPARASRSREAHPAPPSGPRPPPSGAAGASQARLRARRRSHTPRPPRAWRGAATARCCGYTS